jgi:hypothetical protein
MMRWRYPTIAASGLGRDAIVLQAQQESQTTPWGYKML